MSSKESLKAKLRFLVRLLASTYVEGGGMYLFISFESLEVKESVPITGCLKSYDNPIFESTITSV
jgi:hypothetical protein